jgi:hypothetical protein
MNLFSKHTFTFTFIKTLKLVKKSSAKASLKTSTCFGPYSMTIFSGSFFVLSASTTLRLPALSSIFSVCGLSRLFVCVSGVPFCGLSGGHDQTTHRQLQRTHIHIDGIRPHTEKINDEAGSRSVVDALSTKNDPLKMVIE